MGQQYSHLSSEERILIEKLHCEQHLSIRRTAERIGRDKSTVSRELRRGLWFASNENGSYRPYRPKRLKTGPWTSGPFYSALAAQRKADLRRREERGITSLAAVGRFLSTYRLQANKYHTAICCGNHRPEPFGVSGHAPPPPGKTRGLVISISHSWSTLQHGGGNGRSRSESESGHAERTCHEQENVWGSLLRLAAFTR